MDHHRRRSTETILRDEMWGIVDNVVVLWRGEREREEQKLLTIKSLTRVRVVHLSFWLRHTRLTIFWEKFNPVFINPLLELLGTKTKLQGRNFDAFPREREALLSFLPISAPASSSFSLDTHTATLPGKELDGGTSVFLLREEEDGLSYARRGGKTNCKSFRSYSRVDDVSQDGILQ